MVDPKNILVIDDDEEMRVALSEALTRSNHNVTTAVDGAEGLKLFETIKPELVITDIRMPNVDGREVLRKIRSVSDMLPVVLITAYGDKSDAAEAIREGASDYLLKPFSLSALEKVIENLFGNPENNNLTKDRSLSKTAARPIVTDDPGMAQALDIAKRVAASKSTVLIHGESGTGKELFARYIHEQSDRRDKPFVAVNCAALPETLLESELFGHEKGAFTGAVSRKIGKFELADNGTILLDEISELDAALQAKLLRALQESEIDRIGGRDPITLNIRVIATTNQNLEKMVEERKFREDLFFRLNVIPLTLPPLREREGDLLLLTEYFIRKFNGIMGKAVEGLSKEAEDVVRNSAWRGNVRELENVMERATLLARNELIEAEDLMLTPATPHKSSGKIDMKKVLESGMTVAEMEKKLILKTLDGVDWNRTRAADMLGVSIRTLRNKLNEYKAKQPGANKKGGD